MTQLIVALDGPEPYELACKLIDIGVSWFKIGPQMMCNYDWVEFTTYNKYFPNIFLDLKLADTKFTVTESVKHFTDAGIAAVSTFTPSATLAAIEAAQGKLKVWQVVTLSDDSTQPSSGRCLNANGVICPGNYAHIYSQLGIDIVVPGVRFNNTDRSGHVITTDVLSCKDRGVTHAVVGRPIYNSPDPIAEAQKFLKALT